MIGMETTAWPDPEGMREIEEGLDNQHGFRSGKLRQRGQGHEHAVDGDDT